MTRQTNLLFEDLHRESERTEKAFIAREISIADIHTQADVSRAESVLLRLADYIYAHTSLKPMSKTLFFVSRCLLLARKGIPITTVAATAGSYNDLRQSLETYAPMDDFDFSAVLNEVEGHLEEVKNSISAIAQLCRNSDTLGLAFNTLLRGKFEGGEGLGTYLTPEEVATPMVEMGLAALEPRLLAELTQSKHASVHFGDICGGTGRFVHAIFRALLSRGASREIMSGAARLYDQSSLAVGLAKLNFIFEDILPEFESVNDSIVADAVSQMRKLICPVGNKSTVWNR